jgi:very-short-patch-repair endonuclease
MYFCEKCNKFFEKRHAFIGHCSSHNRKKKQKQIKKHICKFCEKEFSSGPLLGNHVRSCKNHPNHKERIKKISNSHKNKPISDIQKHNISNSMKLAHKEGRAWNIGKSRWNNKPSYPEEFFIKVIKNEFLDKNYEREYPLGIYSLDFAWVKKKKVIEIDGEQHERFEEYKERDKRKDIYIKNLGWKILRISWRDMSNNTKNKIEECKKFIEKP